MAKSPLRKYTDGRVGGYLVGRPHSQGGIKARVVDTGETIEVESKEVIINKRSVEDPDIHVFDGQRMTNKQILSSINKYKNYGVPIFEEGGQLCGCSGVSHTYDGKEMTDFEINRQLSEGGQIGDWYTETIFNYRAAIPQIINRQNGVIIYKQGDIVYLYDQLVNEMENDNDEQVLQWLRDPTNIYYIQEIIETKTETQVIIHNGLTAKSILTDLDNLYILLSSEMKVLLTEETIAQVYGISVKKAEGGFANSDEGKKLRVKDIPEVVRDILPEHQLRAILGTTELWGVIDNLKENIEKVPALYETEEIPLEDKIIYLHYFARNIHYYVTERGSDNEKYTAFGYVYNQGEGEWGYFNLMELKSVNATELDFYFTPVKFSTLENKLFSEEWDIKQNEKEKSKNTAGVNNPFLEQEPEVSQVISNQASSLTLQQQAKINNEIIALINKNGIDPSKYSAQDIALIKQYTGAGGKQKHGVKGARLLDQFFTPMDIVAKMWGMCVNAGFNFKNANILEPAVGSGNFLQFIPQDVGARVVAYDVDETSYKICKILFPDYDIRHGSFETMFFNNRRHIGLAGVEYFFDLVIGNPPYRDYVSEYAPLGEKDATGAFTFEMYFIMRGVDVLKPGGLLCMIIPNNFLSNDNKYNEFKNELNRKAELLDAYRLPNGVFDNTEVGTDIILLRKRGKV